MGLKSDAIRSKVLRDSAQGQQCTLHIPGVCNQNPETTVLCHLDGEEKGRGLKTDDLFAVYGCSACHAAIDGHDLTRDEKLYYEHRALRRTLKRMVRMGVVTVKGYMSG